VHRAVPPNPPRARAGKQHKTGAHSCAHIPQPPRIARIVATRQLQRYVQAALYFLEDTICESPNFRNNHVGPRRTLSCVLVRIGSAFC
jgi:hypothetical protein